MQAAESPAAEAVQKAALGVTQELSGTGVDTLRNSSSFSLSGYERNLFCTNDRGRFTNIGSLVGIDVVLDSRSVAAGDVDGDGDLDLVLRNFNNPRLLLMRNVAPQVGHHLEVSLEGPPGNPSGLGAIVTVRVGERSQAQAVVAGSGFMTQEPDVLYFGLGEARAADRIEVWWPGGVSQVVSGPHLHGTHVRIRPERESGPPASSTQKAETR